MHLSHRKSSEQFQCFACKRRTHITCAQIGLDTSTMDKIKRPGSDFFGLCVICKDKRDKGLLVIGGSEAYQNLLKQFNSEKDNNVTLKSMYENKELELQAQIFDLTRQIEEFKKNRGRDRDVPGMSTTEIKALIAQQGEMFEKLLKSQQATNEKLINTLIIRQNDLSSTVDQINNYLMNGSHAPQQSSVHTTAASRMQSPAGRTTATSNAAVSRPSVQRNANSYARVLAASSTPIGAIRNLNIMGEEPETSLVAEQLRKDTLCTGAGIVSIKSKGKTNFTIKCVNEAEAQKVEASLRTKYPTIVVKPVVPIKPQVKLTRIFTELEANDQIIAQLREQNHWLQKAEFTIDRSYEITTSNSKYSNLILNCDLATQTLFLKKGICIFGFNECRVFEYLNLLQCNNCLRYGHYARECRFVALCKVCADKHMTAQCTLETNTRKCANCNRANAKGANFNARHRANDEKCPIRIERIEALKQLHLTKN